MENQIFLNREIVSLMLRAGLQDLLPEKQKYARVKLRQCSKSWKTAKSKYAAQFAQMECNFCRVYEVVVFQRQNFLRPEN
jgi:hypothetical protein